MNDQPCRDPGAARIGFVGLGRMGLPMAARLAAAGFEVTAADLRSQRQVAADAAGLRWASGGADAAAGADLLITMLPGPGEVTQAAAGLSEALAPGTTWIDMSTAAPRVVRKLGELAAPRRLRLLDAPVGGGPAAAGAGSLLAFVGGALEDLVRWRPVLGVLADRVIHTGPRGTGYAVKLLVNALWFSHAVASAEALTLGRRMGLELEGLRAALAQSAAASHFLDTEAVALLDGEDLTDFPLARCCEELASVLALGRELDVPLQLTSAVADVHLSALERYGDVDGELLGARLVAQRAGVRLRRG